MEYECDICECEFEPSDHTFVGQLHGPIDCCETTVINQLCETCYQKHLEENFSDD